jgi:hypothetical protein
MKSHEIIPATLTHWQPPRFRVGDYVTFSGKLWVVIEIPNATTTLTRRAYWYERLWFCIQR